VVGKIINVRFDANVAPSMPWKFEPEQRVQRVAIGARDMEFFNATNMSAKPITGTATFNVTPEQAGQYFTKIQCFCFTEQTLQPGETMRMPVVSTSIRN
jgi:cytochrome c oxidase assembly protein subunit 11